MHTASCKLEESAWMSPDPLLMGVVWGQAVTDMLPVEAFVIEIKLESSDNVIFKSQSR